MSTDIPEDLLSVLAELAGTASVLYVEDEPQIRDEIAEMLGTLFGTVVTAENGREGWARYQQGEFVLVITDINMPEMSGLDLIAAMQKVRPQQAILVTSAYSDASNLIPLINLGIGSFVLKPLNWKVFLHLVHKELAAAVSMEREAQYQKRLEKEVHVRTQEVREMQQELVKLQEAKENMLGLISHELRTPLNGILGFLDLLRSSIATDEGQSFLGLVEESARRLERSTRKALDFTALSTGNRTLRHEPHRVDSLLVAAMEQLADRFENRERMRVVWLTRVEDAVLTTDPELVVEALKNLVENVDKYAGTRPTLWLSQTTEGPWDVLTLRDSGKGFPEAMVSQLFQPFATGNIMHHSEGMGLGLALVDVIMLTLGGRVEARNADEGGALIRLRFPRRS